MRLYPEACGFDRVIVTVGSPEQKTLYEAVLPSFAETGGTVFSVIPDGENGERIGSGGALLKALAGFPSAQALSGKRILLVLTGGNSKRAPGFAVRGKALAPAGTDTEGAPLSVLDRILSRTAALAEKSGAGVLVCCGDILPDLSGVAALPGESTAFCVAADIAAGTRHGVMFPDSDGLLCDYLQKQPAETLSVSAARCGMRDTVPLDAGWVWFSPSYVGALYAVAPAVLETVRRAGAQVNLFTDILPVNAAHTEREAFLSSGVREVRETFWNALRKEPLRVRCLPGPLMHFGTPGEILANNRLLSRPRETLVFNSSVADGANVGEGCLLENVRLGPDTQIGKNSLLTDIELQGVRVPENTSVFGVRLNDGRFVACVGEIVRDPGEAGEKALREWDLPLFYPAQSFTESFLCYTNRADAEKMSVSAVTANADPRYYPDWRRFLSDLLRSRSASASSFAAYRERILNAHFDRCSPPARIRCVKERAQIELPVRVNFSGTWTDCMPYCIENGGEVVNAAVKVNGRYPIRVTAERIREKRIEMCNADAVCAAEIYRPGERAPALSDCNLHRAVLRTLGVDEGTVIEDGVRLTVGVSGIMKGSGLGTSSILLFGCFRALSELLGLALSDETVLSYVFVAEQIMRTGGGWQDQGAMLCGGLKAVSSAPGLPQKIGVSPLPCDPAFLKTLSDRLVLVSTGQRHFGRFIVTDVMDRYLSGDMKTAAGFAGLSALNARTRTAVSRGDVGAFGACMELHAKYLDLLSPLIYNNIIKVISEKCLQWADGCSICGAGGGGYLAVLLKEGVPAGTLRAALQTEVLSLEIL